MGTTSNKEMGEAMRIISTFLIISLLCFSTTIEAQSSAPASMDQDKELSAEDLLQKGFKHKEANNPILAMQTWKKAVEKGSGTAAAQIGILYMLDAGIPRNYENAEKWFDKAIEMKAPRGFAFKARFLMDPNRGKPVDAAKAYALIHSVEDTKDDSVSFTAGLFYTRGWGTPVDYKKAQEFFQRITNAKMSQDALKILEDAKLANTPIPASELMQQISRNKPRFDKSYLGKWIVAEGYVGEIKQLKSSGLYVLWLRASDSLEGKWISCVFNKDQSSDELAALDFGEKVKIRGFYLEKPDDFIVEDIVLRGCEILQ